MVESATSGTSHTDTRAIDPVAVLHAGVAHLASVCDYAEERDGAGFSATDATVGHFLAELDPSRWETVHVVTARALLPTYRRQLGPELTEQIRAVPAGDDQEVADARATVRGQGRAARERQYRTRHSYIALELEQNRVRVGFPYDEHLVALSRAIPGRRYDGQSRSNVYPLVSLPAVLGFATQADIPVDPEVLAVAKDVANRPDAYRPVAVTCDPNQATVLVVAADFDPDLNQALRTINGGSTWSRTARVHLVDVAAGPAALLDLFTSRGLRMSPDAQAVLSAAAAAPASAGGTVTVSDRWTLTIAPTSSRLGDILRRQLRQLAGGVLSRRDVWGWPLHIEPQRALDLFNEHHLDVDAAAHAALTDAARAQADNLTASIARTGPTIDIPGLGVTLLPHQHCAVRYAVARRRLIIGDEMGLGKTITSCAAAAAVDAFPLIVACKPDLTENWRSEVSRVLPGRSVTVATGMTPTAPPDGTEVVIIGYSALGSRRSQGRSESFPWVEQLAALNPQALIIDEGHLGKEVSAARSRAVAALGRSIAACDGLIMNLTGTAVVNRPRELAQQLITLGVLAPKGEPVQPWHLFGEEGAFLFRYCGPADTGYGWTFTGASNTAELHHRLRAWGLFLRRGQNAVELPDFDRVALRLAIDDLDPDALVEYREAERAAAAEFADQARELADQLGVGAGDPRVRAAMRGRTSDHLTRLNQLRQILGRAKLPAISRWIRTQIDAGEKVMIAAHHREVVDAYADRFGGLKIQGGQTTQVKEAHKARFQNDPQITSPTITVSIAAGGVGHTLTAARLGIQAELCWTPGELNQMAKRIHRIGQTRPVTYNVAVATGTIDDTMWTMITDKQHTLDAVLDGTPTTDADQTTNAAAEIAWQLSQARLARIATA